MRLWELLDDKRPKISESNLANHNLIKSKQGKGDVTPEAAQQILSRGREKFNPR